MQGNLDCEPQQACRGLELNPALQMESEVGFRDLKCQQLVTWVIWGREPNVEIA